MVQIGTRVDETGTLLREDGEFVLRRDVGGRWKLDFHRVPAGSVGDRVRIAGVIVSEDLIDVDAIEPDSAIEDAA